MLRHMADDGPTMAHGATVPAFDRLAASVGLLESLAEELATAGNAVSGADRQAIREQLRAAIALIDRHLGPGHG